MGLLKVVKIAVNGLRAEEKKAQEIKRLTDNTFQFKSGGRDGGPGEKNTLKSKRTPEPYVYEEEDSQS